MAIPNPIGGRAVMCGSPGPSVATWHDRGLCKRARLANAGNTSTSFRQFFHQDGEVVKWKVFVHATGMSIVANRVESQLKRIKVSFVPLVVLFARILTDAGWSAEADLASEDDNPFSPIQNVAVRSLPDHLETELPCRATQSSRHTCTG